MAITYRDAAICGAKDKDPSLHIHRIATNPDFKGYNWVGHIVAWAKTYAKAANRKYIRLDTCGNNTRLINLYISNGFNFLGMEKMPYSEALPVHYHDADVCLFELEV